jgi:hypothetical protein
VITGSSLLACGRPEGLAGVAIADRGHNSAQVLPYDVQDSAVEVPIGGQ